MHTLLKFLLSPGLTSLLCIVSGWTESFNEEETTDFRTVDTRLDRLCNLTTPSVSSSTFDYFQIGWTDLSDHNEKATQFKVASERIVIPSHEVARSSALSLFARPAAAMVGVSEHLRPPGACHGRQQEGHFQESLVHGSWKEQKAAAWEHFSLHSLPDFIQSNSKLGR